MSADDLIRQAVARGWCSDVNCYKEMDVDLAEAITREVIAALPAVAPGVRVKPLVWIDFEGKGAKAPAWNEANYMIQLWSDGRYEISASYPGYSTFIEGTDRWYDTLDAAKAAAQADYERRIITALDTPAPAMGELVEAAKADPRVVQLEAEIKALADVCDCECDDDDCVRCSHYPAILEQKRKELAALTEGDTNG
jgi:hypothetical protein